VKVEAVYIHPSGAKQAAEKGPILDRSCEKQTSGAKAHADFAGFMYGLKPVPFNASGFSAAFKARRFLIYHSRRD
jgi:hypothetical protein